MRTREEIVLKTQTVSERSVGQAGCKESACAPSYQDSCLEGMSCQACQACTLATDTAEPQLLAAVAYLTKPKTQAALQFTHVLHSPWGGSDTTTLRQTSQAMKFDLQRCDDIAMHHCLHIIACRLQETRAPTYTIS